MAPALQIELIYSKLKELGFRDRNIRELDRDEEWKAIQFRNHQIFFLRTKLYQYTFRHCICIL